MFCQFEAISMDTWVMFFVSDTDQVHDLCQKSNMLASF